MQTPASERLYYRRLAPADVGAFHRLARDPYIARFLLDGEQVPLAWSREELASSEASFRRLGIGLWLVHEHEVGEPIGFAGFKVFVELDHQPQLLYALREPYCNRGYATEIARALVEFARARGIRPIVSAADEPNLASRRVLEKAGFVEAGAVPGAFGAIVLYVHERPADGAPRQLSRTLEIASTWDGRAADEGERVALALELDATQLRVSVEAPWHGDPAPASPPGRCPRLWEHEVVELFLLGEHERYLEVELGPHGHYLVLALHGRRTVVSPAPDGQPIFYTAERHGACWRGEARVPRGWLPPGLARLNAYAIHGPAQARRHLAWHAVPGAAADFHRLESFAPLVE